MTYIKYMEVIIDINIDVQINVDINVNIMNIQFCPLRRPRISTNAIVQVYNKNTNLKF